MRKIHKKKINIYQYILLIYTIVVIISDS